jgi:integrase
MDNTVLNKLKKIPIIRKNDQYRPTHKKADLFNWLSVNENLKTTRASKDLNAIILKFVFWTGLRISEVCNLKVEHVMLDQDKILVLDGKGGKNRWVGINKQLKPDLIDYISKRQGVHNAD